MEIVNEITERHLAYWSDFEPDIVTFTSPDDVDDCVPCRSVVTTVPNRSGQVVRVAWKPNEIDLAHLAAGGTVWLSTWGGLPPHMLEVQAP